MDQAQIKSLAAIQPFVHEAVTAKTPTPRYLADLISRATSAPTTYIFTELLQTPAIQSLRAPETPEAAKAHLTLLEIFSWGTYDEYQNTPNLPALNASQTEKLRELTLLTLASPLAPQTENSHSTNALTYDALISALSLPDTQSLEALLTAAIYSGLLSARLSPTSQPPSVQITSVAPLRDLRPQSLPALLEILNTWNNRCAGVISDLEAQITAIQSNAAERAARDRKRQDVIDMAVLGNEGDKILGGHRLLRNRQGNKRELEDTMEGEEGEDPSSDDLKMDVDEAMDMTVSGTGGGPAASIRNMVGAGGSSRGAKKSRGKV